MNSKNKDNGNSNQLKASRTAGCIHQQRFMDSTSTWLRRSLRASFYTVWVRNKYAHQFLYHTLNRHSAYGISFWILLLVSDIRALKYFVNITERLPFATVMLYGYSKL
jgi:hypothetical protein